MWCTLQVPALNAQLSRNEALSSINIFLLSEKARKACIVSCQQNQFSFIESQFDSITDPDERADAITRYYETQTPCDEQCIGQTVVDSSSTCTIGCLDNALSAVLLCPTLSSDDLDDLDTLDERIARGSCLFNAADSLVMCNDNCRE